MSLHPPARAGFSLLDQRWFYAGRDVSDLPMWWSCINGHQWQGTLHQGTTRAAGCPICAGDLRLVGRGTPQPAAARIA